MNDFKEKEEKPRQSRVLLLLLALGLALLLLSLNQRYKSRERELNDQLAQLMNQLGLQGEQLEASSQQIGLLVTDPEIVQKRVGVTQNEIEQARSAAKEIREDQQKDVQALNRQLATKADSKQVDAKIREVDEQITGVQQEVQASRQELEKTGEELSALELHVTEQGKLVATNADALEELRRRGERDELLSKVVYGPSSGSDLILPDSVDEFHVFNDFTQTPIAL
jgi:regulator of replication initiation timing